MRSITEVREELIYERRVAVIVGAAQELELQVLGRAQPHCAGYSVFSWYFYALLPDPSINTLTQQVGMATMPGILLDPMHLKFSHGDLFPTYEQVQILVLRHFPCPLPAVRSEESAGPGRSFLDPRRRR